MAIGGGRGTLWFCCTLPFFGPKGAAIMQSGTAIEEIRRRAYEIWQAEGCPRGRHVDNWLQAEAECQARLRPARNLEEPGDHSPAQPPDGGTTKPQRKRKSPK